MGMKHIPEGYHSVIPYLVVPGIPKLIEFLVRAFDGVETERMTSGEGVVRHAEVRIGDSVVMMGEASEEHPKRSTMLYVYVPDTDATYRKALEAGGKSIMEPKDQFYGDRNAAIEDPSGNQWWIATRKEQLSKEELSQRASETWG